MFYFFFSFFLFFFFLFIYILLLYIYICFNWAYCVFSCLFNPYIFLWFWVFYFWVVNLGRAMNGEYRGSDILVFNLLATIQHFHYFNICAIELVDDHIYSPDTIDPSGFESHTAPGTVCSPRSTARVLQQTATARALSTSQTPVSPSLSMFISPLSRPDNPNLKTNNHSTFLICRDDWNATPLTRPIHSPCNKHLQLF